MKNQYFGDVNDYRKYGLLRKLAGNGELRLGVCWMLTPNDSRPDGRKTEYLAEDAEQKCLEYQHFDPKLYNFLREWVLGHEKDERFRDIRHFDDSRLPKAHFWTDNGLSDSDDDRQLYFNQMWDSFDESDVNLIFFDPDNGLANNGRSKSPLKKGHKGSSKKLFRDEVQVSLDKGFSVLIYQHFPFLPRQEFVDGLGSELSKMRGSGCAYSFWTPHVVFFLVPLQRHMKLIRDGVERIINSEWAAEKSALTSRTNDKRQILVGRHTKKGVHSTFCVGVARDGSVFWQKVECPPFFLSRDFQ